MDSGYIANKLLNTTYTALYKLQPVLDSTLSQPYAHTTYSYIQQFYDFSLSLETWYYGIPLLDIFFGIFAARNCRLATKHSNINIVQLYVSYLLSTLGGSILVSYLLSQPVGWLTVDLPLLVYSGIFLLFQIPVLSDVLIFMTNNSIIQFIVNVFVDITWMTSMTSYSFDASLRSLYAVKNSSVGPIFVSFVAGIGGPLLNQTLSLYKEKWSLTSPPLLSINPITIMVSICSLTYYTMLNHKGVFTHQPFTRYQARATVLTIILLSDTVRSTLSKIFSSSGSKPLKAAAINKKTN